CGDAVQGIAMATLPIPGLLAEFKILGLQAMDFGAQLSHFRARVLHWGVQLREEMTGKTDLCQLAVHDHLGLTKIAPKGKGLVLLQPEQKVAVHRCCCGYPRHSQGKEPCAKSRKRLLWRLITVIPLTARLNGFGRESAAMTPRLFRPRVGVG